MGNEGDMLSFFRKNVNDVINFIEKNVTSNQSKKTTLSGLFILTQDTKYRDAMLVNTRLVNDFYKTQKTLPQREHLDIKLEDLQKHYDKWLVIVKRNPTISNYQMYFLASFTSCKILIPRRNEWIHIKLRNINKNTDNYIDSKGNFRFNVFKTVKFHDKDSLERCVPCPKELLNMINKYKKISDNDYLFYIEKTEKPWSSSYYTKQVQQLYSDLCEGVTTDVIRSTYASQQEFKLSDLQDTAAAMGSSVNALLNFYVKDDEDEQK
jgi:hypothetical protein